jgi:hypothetical protein
VQQQQPIGSTKSSQFTIRYLVSIASHITMSDQHGDDNYVILYPAGGAFNKLRCKQSFLLDLLDATWLGYSNVPLVEKTAYIRDHILDCIKSSGRTLMRFEGKHPESGSFVHLSEYDAIEQIRQKLRDTKKRQLRAKRKTKTTFIKSSDAAFTPAIANDFLDGKLL